MVGRAPHADDSESDWDSISQPIPAAQQLPDQSVPITPVQQPPSGIGNYDEKVVSNYSPNQETDVTDSGTNFDGPETARFTADIRTKWELNNRSLSGDSQNLPSLPYDQTRVSPRIRQDGKIICDSDENKTRSWDSGLVSSKGNPVKQQSAYLTDILDIEIGSHNPISTQSIIERNESYLFKPEKWKVPSLNSDEAPEERVNTSSKSFLTQDCSREINYIQKEMSHHGLTKLPLSSNGESKVHLIDEPTEIFPYERCNVEFHKASDRSTKSFADSWNAKVLPFSNRFWLEVTSVMETPFIFLLAFVLQLIRFFTTGLITPLIVGLFRGISDGILKPVLCVLHNAFFVPTAVFVHNLSLALHTALLPIGSIIAIVTEALARLLQSFRLVEVHLHSDTWNDRYTVGRDRKDNKTTAQRV